MNKVGEKLGRSPQLGLRHVYSLHIEGQYGLLTPYYFSTAWALANFTANHYEFLVRAIDYALAEFRLHQLGSQLRVVRVSKRKTRIYLRENRCHSY